MATYGSWLRIKGNLWFMVHGEWLRVNSGSWLMVTTYQYGIREEGI